MANATNLFVRGMGRGLPILVGYLPIAVAFGLLAREAALPWEAAVGLSVFVFAGASQFIAVELYQLGAGAIEIVVTTFLVNLRHLLMSATVSARLLRPMLKPLIAFGVTDETFAVATTDDRDIDPKELAGLELVPYLSWCGGTALGFLFGEILPPLVQQGLGVTLYALFVYLLLPSAVRSAAVAVTAGSAAAAHTLLRIAEVEPGVALVIAIVIGTAVGTAAAPKLDAQASTDAGGESDGSTADADRSLGAEGTSGEASAAGADAAPDGEGEARTPGSAGEWQP